MADWTRSDFIATASLIISFLAFAATRRQAKIAERVAKQSEEREQPLVDAQSNAIDPWPGWYEVHLRINNRSPYFLSIEVEVALPKRATIVEKDPELTYYVHPSPAPSPPKRRSVPDLCAIEPGGIAEAICLLFDRETGVRRAYFRTTMTNANRRLRDYVIDTEFSLD